MEEAYIPRIQGFSLYKKGGVNAIKILGYSPLWEDENNVVVTLCMVHKMFPYMNMHIDHVRPRRTRWYVSLSIWVIRQSGKETHPSVSPRSVCITFGFLLV